MENKILQNPRVQAMPGSGMGAAVDSQVSAPMLMQGLNV